MVRRVSFVAIKMKDIEVIITNKKEQEAVVSYLKTNGILDTDNLKNITTFPFVVFIKDNGWSWSDYTSFRNFTRLIGV